MSTAELKSNLHQIIDRADSKTLNMLYALLAKKSTAKTDWWDSISAKEKAAIEDGIKDIEEGNVFTQEQVRKKLKAKFPGLLK